MKKINVKDLYTAYNDKIELGPRTATELAMNTALSDLEDIATDELFWKILLTVTDVLEEQKQLAFMAGYKAGAKAKTEPNKAEGSKKKVELAVVAA